jgi:hypothetical protein
MNEKIQEMAKFARREASLYGGKFGDADFTKRYNEIFAEMIVRECHRDIQDLVVALREIQIAAEDWSGEDVPFTHRQNYRDFAQHAKEALAKWEGK